jgi:hypothetical protein
MNTVRNPIQDATFLGVRPRGDCARIGRTRVQAQKVKREKWLWAGRFVAKKWRAFIDRDRQSQT